MTRPLAGQRHAPAHLRNMTSTQLWREFRRNRKNLWEPWKEDAEYLRPTMLEAAELLDQIEGVGGTVEINLDVSLPLDCEFELDEDDRQLLHDCGEMIKELLRFNREADYNLRALSER